MTLREEYRNSIQGLETVFEVPEQLRRLFVEAFDRASNINDLPTTIRQRLINQAGLFRNIRDLTLGNARKRYSGQLYEYGVIFIVSVSEQILKSAFNSLISSNMEKIKVDPQFNVTYADLKKNNFILDRLYWTELLIKELFDTKNPQERANFQNVKAIENLFKSYFNISLEEVSDYKKISKKVHLYFQIRHILVHNQGIEDERFITNLKKAGIEASPPLRAGTQIRITRTRFEDCQDAFNSFFIMLDNAISSQKLKMEEPIYDPEDL